MKVEILAISGPTWNEPLNCNHILTAYRRGNSPVFFLSDRVTFSVLPTYIGGRKGIRFMDSKAFGARIQLYRVRGKMTQKKLAEKLGCTSQHISAIERGVKTPTLETFVVLCNVLQVQPNLLLQDVIEGWQEGWEADIDRMLAVVPPHMRWRIKQTLINAQQAVEEHKNDKIRQC